MKDSLSRKDETTKASLRILHLEDDPNDAELVRATLFADGLGAELERVAARESFVEALKRGQFKLILSDYAVPGFNGLDALRLARDLAEGVPFIFVSGTLGEEAAIESVRGGATDYVLKHRLSRLGQAVRRALREAEGRRQRQQSEEDLRKSQELLQIVSRATNDVVWDWELETDSVWWNENFQTLFGYAAEEVGQDLASWSSRVHPADLKAVMDSVRQMIDGGGRSWSGEYRFRRRDGAYAHILSRGHILRDAGGKAVRMIGAMIDVTERKKLEEQLRGAQKMEAIGRLAGGIAHDFNNLLTVINGYSEILLTRVEGGSPLAADLQEINKAGQRAATLTRQLLAFSRRQILEPKVLDLNPVISELEKMLRRLIGEDIELAARLDPAIGRVKIDPGQLEQVIMNLAVNARDAMPQGGKLSIETVNVELDEAYAAEHAGARAGSYVMLAVSDEGCGMDETVKSHLFEPFFTTKEKGKGTGLGLATVYGIVKQHGGYIWVYSEVGRGTTFKIHLPRVEGAVEYPRPRGRGTGAQKGSETVLVVEDDPAVRRLVEEALRRNGYQVLMASSSNEARNLCLTQRRPIDLLLTDVVMPDLSGHELAKLLELLRPGLRVLYMSGYTDDTIVHHGVLDAGTAFLQKPFSPDALAAKVREVLDSPEGGNPARG